MVNSHFSSPTKAFIALLFAFLFMGCNTQAPQKILIFSKTMGYHHESIDTGIATITQLAEAEGVAVDTTTDASWFNKKQLEQYAAVVFLSTTGDVLDDNQQAHFENYIQNGGGFAGIHAAADTEYDWPWYNQLVGAYFLSHPHQQNAELTVLDKTHPATQKLPSLWKRFDEWYNYRNMVDGLQVLINLEESSYEGGENGESHPISWYREFDGGRMFYTGLGHTHEAYGDEDFQQHIWGGIRYAMGNQAR